MSNLWYQSLNQSWTAFKHIIVNLSLIADKRFSYLDKSSAPHVHFLLSVQLLSYYVNLPLATKTEYSTPQLPHAVYLAHPQSSIESSQFMGWCDRSIDVCVLGWTVICRQAKWWRHSRILDIIPSFGHNECWWGSRRIETIPASRDLVGNKFELNTRTSCRTVGGIHLFIKAEQTPHHPNACSWVIVLGRDCSGLATRSKSIRLTYSIVNSNRRTEDQLNLHHAFNGWIILDSTDRLVLHLCSPQQSDRNSIDQVLWIFPSLSGLLLAEQMPIKDVVRQKSQMWNAPRPINWQLSFSYPHCCSD